MKNTLSPSLISTLALVVMGAVACDNSGSGSPAQSSGSPSASNTSTSGSVQSTAAVETVNPDIASISEALVSEQSATVQNTASAAPAPVTAPSVDGTSLTLPACVTLSSQSTNIDRLYDLSCPNVTGTLEYKSLALDSIELISNLNVESAAGTKGQLSSQVSASETASGAIAYSRTFDDKIQSAYSQFEISGNSTAGFTPDSTAAAANTVSDSSSTVKTGDIVLSGSFDYIKNTTTVASFALTSTGLHLSSCGLNAGTIEFKNLTDDVVVTIQACGQNTITLNGVAVALPKN